MIEAKHNILADKIFNIYITRLLKKYFSHFYLLGDIPQINTNEKILITPNHISWWDGFFIYFVAKKILNRKIHVLMLEDQLKKYWFFKYVGAFSINLQNKYSMIQSIKYTRKILDSSSNFVVFYPQGEIQPFEQNPIKLKEGIKLVIKNIDDVSVLPVLFKIQYGNEKLPDIFMKFGEPTNGKEIGKNFNNFQSEFQRYRDMLDELSKTKNSFINLFEK